MMNYEDYDDDYDDDQDYDDDIDEDYDDDIDDDEYDDIPLLLQIVCSEWTHQSTKIYT